MNIDGKVFYFLSLASIISQKPLQIAIILSDITQQEIYKHELEQLVITDVLTKIKNRRYYEQKIQEEIVRACRYNEKLSIIIFDIDFFKKVNDSHGHDIGDKILIEYTRLISSILRNSDSFCRIGGEEFVIITPQTSQDEAYKLAEKIRKEVEKYQVILPITLSFGVTEHRNEEDKDTMFKRADNALYKAKTSGRNRVVIG
jgi:diguanylate cyclase (GGDEF)-like protein